MASLEVIIIVFILGATDVLGIQDKTRDINVKNDIRSLEISDNLDSDEGTSNIFSQLLQRSSKGICGVPTPKCTTKCFGENGCSCHQRITGSYSYYIHQCREHSKICAAGSHELFDYNVINPLHSASLPANPRCNKIRQGVTEQEKQQILDMHNRYRSKVARGAESRSPQQGVAQPSGANIKELIWNNELAFIAQKWAEQCNFQHDDPSSRRSPCSRPYVGTGQNLYERSTSRKYTTNQWPTAIQRFYDEVADSPVSIVPKYASGVTSKLIGHYHQLVWAETYEIGCGAVYYTGGNYEHGSTTLYVCNYGPAGNIIGDEMYKIGKPATECGKAGESIRYPGLCATLL